MLDKIAIYKLIVKYSPISFIELAKKAHIKIIDNKNLTKLLNDWIKENKLIITSKGNYIPIKHIKTVVGELKYVNEGKFAFVDIFNEDNEVIESIFVSKNDFNNALPNDTVQVAVYQYFNDEKNYGKVEKIINVQTKYLTGIINFSKNKFLFEPINKMYSMFSFQFKQNNLVINEQDIIKAQIVKKNKNILIIEPIKIISNSKDPMAFVEAYNYENNVPNTFPEEVLLHSQLIDDEIDIKDLKNRVDLRDKLIVTIDGENTKDFDDAISVKKINDNLFELNVHIADVAYYVKENDPIDNEAVKRGTSIYLVNKVIPMLPEKLSNGICSLNPNVDRYTLTVSMQINKSGQTIDKKIFASIINSKYRLTYQKVNDYFNKNILFEDKQLNLMLNEAIELSKILSEYKKQQGYIDLEINEPIIKTDEKGKVIDICIKNSGFSETMIENFMVKANEAVAEYLTDLKIPFLYRIHDQPNEEKILYFENVLDQLNINYSIDKNNITPLNFQNIIENIKKQRNDEFIKTLFLRTMSKAIYSKDNIGHFGLASKFYCHFTSPIRRYPDLIVHRALREIVFQNNIDKNEYLKKLDSIAKLNNDSEKFALETERNTNDLKFAEYWENKIGQIHVGQVISLMPFGIFVQFENKTDAMIHITNMCDNEYKLNDNKTEFVSQNRKIKLGDYVKVIISSADKKTGKVDGILFECQMIRTKNNE
ncbi:ribonuclease R [Mycoplasma sp. 1018B]|uniref:ribonuclease R n=1 Tax=Mycoplasma sp. 1018B TaxID=2967302 RepID=UPI00211C0B53|nr:ribonuclease R [Mycoplasma sp. 1018B]UUM19248.1 ribonuclease R [Mycoplasma sp. 1018B]